MTVTSESLEVQDPATGAVCGRVPVCGPDRLERVLAEAATAATEWAADEAGRRDLLRDAARALVAAAREIGGLVTLEQGKPLMMAVGEVHAAAAQLRYYAGLDLPAESLPGGRRGRTEVSRRPLGVVAAITPWNFPIAIAGGKIAPALRAGNTVVLKPSPFTPLATIRMGEVLATVLPANVLTVVAGGDDLGAALAAHPTPRLISFTGSVPAGRKVAAAAGAGLKRVTLELGGNDAAIVLDDVDPAAVAERLFWNGFANTGQACMLIKRLYVPRARYADMVEALAQTAGSARIGDGRTPGVQLGPISTLPQYERVVGLVDAAKRAGAVSAAGGSPAAGPGLFYPPTVLAGAAEGMAVVDEEQFGPVLPVLAYDDEPDAVRRANAGGHGLGGSVWSADPDRAASVARQLECGTAWVNSHAVLSPDQPYGGLKDSGIGVENGVLGLFEYTAVRVDHQPATVAA